MAIFKLHEFQTVAQLQEELVECMGNCLQVQDPAPFAVMLSGGKTPLDIYSALMGQGRVASDAAHIFYSDERDVPIFSEENNYQHTVALLRSLRIPESRVMRVHTEQPLQVAAFHYNRELRRFLDGGGRIPLGILGIGPDGHTASLFSPDDVKRGGERYAIAIPHDPKPDRISVTPRLLARVKRLIILASGKEKREIVAKLLKTPEQVVAGQALHDVVQVEIWQA